MTTSSVEGRMVFWLSASGPLTDPYLRDQVAEVAAPGPCGLPGEDVEARFVLLGLPSLPSHRWPGMGSLQVRTEGCVDSTHQWVASESP